MDTQQHYTVRAMPAQGHDRRWGAGRPFTRTPVDVVVTDTPKPHAKGVGEDANRIVSYSYEVTPTELEELRSDPHLFVAPKGTADADPLELNAAKAKIQDLERQIADARKAHQGEIEDLKTSHSFAAKQAEELGAKVQKLEGELHSAHAQLAERKTTRK